MSNAKIVEIAAVRDKVAARVAEEAQAAPPESDSGITSRFVQDCLLANELGDGMLYAEKLRGRYVYMAGSKEWLAYQGSHWTLDATEQHLTVVEEVVDEYLKVASELGDRMNKAMADGLKETFKDLQSQQAAIYKRINRLRSTRGRKACLEFACTCPDGLIIKGDELDMHPMLFPCANGVIDLTTGVLRDGRQDDYLFRASPVVWQGIHEPCPKWLKFLGEIFEGNQALIDFVQRLFGYCLTGRTTNAILPILIGEGRNGKTVLCEMAMYCMGELSGPIRSELLLDQGNGRSADSASPAIMGLKGMRLVTGSETGKNKKFSMEMVKLLSGGDTLTGRYLYDKRDTSFTPTHKLILYTNHLPHAIAEDFAFWERLLVIPFRLAFVNREPAAENERRANPDLRVELESEASGILAWLVEGCLLWQRDGLNPPEEVRLAVKEFRRDEDYLADFLEECCEIGDDHKAFRVSKADLYDRFERWYLKAISSNPKKVPKDRAFGNDVGKRFEKLKTGGITHYLGLRLRPETDSKGS